MKNVLLIGSELGKGGAERSISLLSYYLQQHYNVTLCILSGAAREKYYQTCDDVVFIDPPGHKNAVEKIKAWRYRLKAIKELKRNRNIDVSISFLEGPDYVNVLTRGREKIVLSIRGSKMHDQLISGMQGKIRKKFLIPWLYKKADHIVCVTDALQNELIEYFNIPRAKAKTIYNFYEVDMIRESASQPLTAEEEQLFENPVIISSGRLHVAKQFDKLIQVFASLKKEKKARLMILGEGDLLSDLMLLCSSLGLKAISWKGAFELADVYFMSFQANPFKYYNRSKLFALTSSWEGFPNVLAEALICHVPVVTTDCFTGPREILDIDNLDNSSILAPVKTEVGTLLPLLDDIDNIKIDMWSNAMQYWLNSSVPPSSAFTALTERFTLQQMLKEWKEVIDN